MFDLFGSHFWLFMGIAVIFLGPRELPIFLRFCGRWVGKMNRTAQEFRTYIHAVTEQPPSASGVEDSSSSSSPASHESITIVQDD